MAGLDAQQPADADGKASPHTTPGQTALASPGLLLDEIRELIEAARECATTAVNAELTLLYQRIGKRIQDEILLGKQADCGETIVATLSRQLVRHHGKDMRV